MGGACSAHERWEMPTKLLGSPKGGDHLEQLIIGVKIILNYA